MTAGPRRIALRTVAGYVVLSTVWIAVSDRVLAWLVEDAALRERVGTVKGFVFVAVTGGLLYLVMAHQLRAWQTESERRHRLEVAHASALAIGAAELHDADEPELQQRLAEARALLDGDREAQAMLGDHAAIALENARLRRGLRAAIAAREHALAMVAHDLRNPLNALALREQLLFRRERSAAIAEHTQAAQQAIAAMNRLIGDLLDASRLERGTMPIAPARQLLRGLVTEVLDTLRPAADDRGIALAHRVPDELEVDADRVRVQQVMFNLIGNALKFTPDGGEVEVIAARTEREVEVSVADTGPGIAAEDLPRVFERYFTGDAARGNGLGLFISKEIVAAHGGRISAESPPGRGARFTFTLPAPAAVRASG